MEKRELAQRLIDFLHDAPTAFNAVKVMREDLIGKGYQELVPSEKWTLKEGDKVFYVKNESSLFVVTIGKDALDSGFRIVGAHTDSPGFRIKPESEMVSDGYLKLNTETYGGPLLATWFDRPLSLAGRVVMKGESLLTPKNVTIDFKKPLLIIPSLAIHMNRKANEGVEIDKQKHVLPVLTLVDKDFKKEGFVKGLVAKELDVEAEDILDFDLFLYEVEKGIIMGLDEEFISSKRQDNLSSVFAALEGIEAGKDFSGINVAAFFDNEESGSTSKQGAGSTLLRNLLERVAYALGGDREGFLRSLENSFIISADLAHSVHPNWAEMHDPTNRPAMNKGPVVKISANQKYTTDADSTAVFTALCRQEEVPCQFFVNRSDLQGGSTIGPITSSHLPIRSIDIGTPLLGMHSVRELGGVLDNYYLVKVLKAFYSLG
ncbi:MAG TPA: M18 family aminopeptidase [Clostridiaceae bacterium]|nr:M18 family aminopeptidase [Clostridiaceae bacterium]